VRLLIFSSHGGLKTMKALAWHGKGDIRRDNKDGCIKVVMKP
jgi:hypothetical protein